MKTSNFNFYKEYLDKEPFIASCWIRLASYERRQETMNCEAAS